MNNSSTKKIFVGGRFVGEVTGGIFQKRIKGSKHILYTPRAIALSVESLRQAEQFGAREIQIMDAETGFTYSCTIEHFKSNSFPIQRGGFEPQLALIIQQFNIVSPLEITSHSPKRGQVTFQRGNGKRIRNPRGVRLESPRQMLFKGMV